jgi:hypothetical protein
MSSDKSDLIEFMRNLKHSPFPGVIEKLEKVKVKKFNFFWRMSAWSGKDLIKVGRRRFSVKGSKKKKRILGKNSVFVLF